MRERLEGKVAVVTGGTSGIGLSSVERFVAEGAQVVFCDLPAANDVELTERLGEVKAAAHHKGRESGGRYDGFAIAERLGDRVHFVPADVSDRAQLAAVIDAAVERFGGVDVMFNNAGIAPLEGHIFDAPDEWFERIIDVNLRAVWWGIKLAGRHMADHGGGSIISTGSLAALDGYHGLSSYTASKAGVVGLTRAAAVELGPASIRVNCICPGAILTPIYVSRNNESEDEIEAVSSQLQPLPRAGRPADVAGTALWLACDDSAFVTGQVIAVDGGVAAEASGPVRRKLVTGTGAGHHAATAALRGDG